MTDDPVEFYDEEGRALEKHRARLQAHYEALDEPFTVKLLVKAGLAKREYKWLDFNERFIVFSISESSKDFTIDQLLEIDSKIERGELDEETKSRYMFLFHVRRIEFAQCWYKVMGVDFKLAYGRLVA